MITKENVFKEAKRRARQLESDAAFMMIWTMALTIAALCFWLGLERGEKKCEANDGYIKTEIHWHARTR